MDPAIDVADLRRLAQTLVQTCGLPVPPPAIDAAVERHLGQAGLPPGAGSDAIQWSDWGADLAHALGLRVSARRARATDLVDELQPDLPALTWTDSGWVMLHRTGAVARWRAAPGDVLRPRPPADLDPDAPRPWLLVEPALPGAMISSETHEPPLPRLLRLIRAERADLRIILLFAVLAAVLTLTVPVAVQIIVNTVAFGALIQPLYAMLAVLTVCLTMAGILGVLQRYLVELIQRRLFVRLAADLAERFAHMRRDAADECRGPQLVHRFFDVVTVQKSAAILLLEGLSAVVQVAVGMVLLAVWHPALLGFDVLLLFTCLVIFYGLGRNGERTAIDESEAKHELGDWLAELAAHPDLYALRGADLATRRADGLSQVWLDARSTHFNVFLRQHAATLAVQVIANVSLLALGGQLVMAGQLSLGQLVAAELIVAPALVAMAKLSDKLETWYDLLAAVDKIAHLVDLPLERRDGVRAPDHTGPADLRVDSIQFAWPDGHVVLDDLSFQLRAGERVAIVGAAGSGRSTLSDLLVARRTPAAGRIRFDGIDLRELMLEAARDGIALVRHSEVISGTFADNIRVGRLDVRDEHIRDATDRIGLAGTVTRLNQGTATDLLGDGTPLSSGERARLAVARAIVTNPRIVVIDGLLDELAPEDTHSILDTLGAPEAPWTLLVLTRDRQLGRRLDRTLLLADGQLRPLPAVAPGPA